MSKTLEMMRYRSYLFLLITTIVLLAIAATACGVSRDIANDESPPIYTYTTFTDKSHGFSLSYPEKWSKMPDEILGAAIAGFSAVAISLIASRLWHISLALRILSRLPVVMPICKICSDVE